MKFPLSENVFPRIQLSPEQCIEFEQLTDHVINDAFDEYDAFIRQHRRQLSKLQWKPIKKREDITVYSERCARSPFDPSRASTAPLATPSHDFTASGSAYDFTASGSAYDFISSSRSNMAFSSTNTPIPSPSASSLSSSYHSHATTSSSPGSMDRRLPKLLAVGSVVGSIEDIVYGMSSPSAAHAMVKAAYTHDEVLDAKVLCEIKSPTPEDPLRFLGLKWLVKGHSNAIGALVRPRDLVYIESTGIKNLADGSRLGFFVMHSVELNECRTLNELSIVRARISSCYLFRTNGGRVDVYMKSFVEMNGNVTDSLALKTSANSLISVWRAMSASLNRKLGWEVTKKQQRNINGHGDVTQHHAVVIANASMATTASCCVNCNKVFSKFSTILACRLCAALLCSKCRDQRELSLPNVPSSTTNQANRGKLVTRLSVNLCRSCVAHYKFRDALEVAKQEILEGQYGSVPTKSMTTTTTVKHQASLTSEKKQDSRHSVALDAPKGSRESLGLLAASVIVKQINLDDIGANLLTESSSPSSAKSAASSPTKATSQRGPRTISMDTVSSSNLSPEDLGELVDMLAYPSSTTSASSSASVSSVPASSRTKTFEAAENKDENAQDLERKDSVIELNRDDGEWTQTASPKRDNSNMYTNEQDLYQRITELHHAAESVYQYAKRTTETVMISSSLAMPPSLLTSLAVDEE